jgi:catalase
MRKELAALALLTWCGISLASGGRDRSLLGVRSAGELERRPARSPARPTSTPGTDWQETIAAGEAAHFADIAREINALQDAASHESGSPVDRGFHAKPHAVLKAELRVSDAIPAMLRVGAFARPATYQAWVRFSNGQSVRQGDRKPDVRGLAVKILNVPGTSFTGTRTLDFLTINHPVQPARNIDQFIAIVRATRHPLTLPIELARAVGAREAVRIITWMATSLGRPVKSVATIDYWTTLPLAFGHHAVKVRIQPKDPVPPTGGMPDADGLRAELVDRLLKADVRFDLAVQLYVDPERTPIEDASVEWKPEVSPWVKVGELVIARRDLTSATAVAEEAAGNKLLFSPWNAPAEHRPLGGLMRARRVVYSASGLHRRATHGSSRFVP